ncbi:MAG: phosphomannomutase [Halioglobus sp.]|nr:phosphomannomutase [Halioglobus sp.]
MKFKLGKKNKAGERAEKPAAGGRTNSPQGIGARGNALRSIAAIAALTVALPTLLGFAYLLLLREPALQAERVDRISRSFATQQATNIHRLFMRIEERVLGAARSPLALSAIGSRSQRDLELLEQTMLDYFPEVISLRIIPIGDMGTAVFAEGNRGLRNHIEVDLVRRSSEGEETQPEAYRFEDGWLTSLAARVQHPGISDRQAVIVVTLDNEQLARQMGSLYGDVGKFSLEQFYTTATGARRSDIVASSGSGEEGDATRHADIPDTAWRVAFSPSRALMQDLEITQGPIFLVLALSLAAGLAAIGVFLLRFPRKLAGEVGRVIAEADRKSALELSVPELVPVAKQLRRATLRALRQSAAAPQAPAQAGDSQAPGLTDPLFQSDAILDDDEVLDLDLAEGDALSSPLEDSGLPEHIFRAYDIRGNASQELDDELVTRIACAIGSIAGEMGEQALVVGCDGRSSSPRIKTALIRALMETGRDVIDIGLVPTPLLYFATRHLDYRSGIMITGSHNPADDNGLKIVLNQQTIAAGGIRDIRDRVVSGQFSKGNGRMIREDIVPAYIEEVLQDIAIAVPLKIVIDAGNGVTGNIAPPLFEELGCEVVPLYCDVDGNFPNHPPDTSNEANLADLARAVKEHGADFGVAFDGDGDRLAVVTSSGRIVRSDILLMLYAQDVVSRNPGADVVFDVKCSRNLTQLITQHGGRPVLWKTGHAFMKEKMRETGALLGGEFSGHIFFGERWFGFDDGMYAAARLAEILSTGGDSLDDVIDKFPSTVNTPEIIIPVPDDYKFRLMDKIVANADFSSGKVNTMDGIRVDFSDGWGLLRASNTVPALTARFEADTASNLEIIQDEFRAQIALIDPEIELDF